MHQCKPHISSSPAANRYGRPGCAPWPPRCLWDWWCRRVTLPRNALLMKIHSCLRLLHVPADIWQLTHNEIRLQSKAAWHFSRGGFYSLTQPIVSALVVLKVAHGQSVGGDFLRALGERLDDVQARAGAELLILGGQTGTDGHRWGKSSFFFLYPSTHLHLNTATTETWCITMWSEFSLTKNRVTSWSASGARPLMKNSVWKLDSVQKEEKKKRWILDSRLTSINQFNDLK